MGTTESDGRTAREKIVENSEHVGKLFERRVRVFFWRQFQNIVSLKEFQDEGL